MNINSMVVGLLASQLVIAGCTREPRRIVDKSSDQTPRSGQGAPDIGPVDTWGIPDANDDSDRSQGGGAPDAGGGAPDAGGGAPDAGGGAPDAGGGGSSDLGGGGSSDLGGGGSSDTGGGGSSDTGGGGSSDTGGGGSSQGDRPNDAVLIGDWDGIADLNPTNKWYIVNHEPKTGTSSGGSSSGGANLVDYQTDVKPILDKHCISCHGPGGRQQGRPMNTFATAKILASGIVQRSTPNTGNMPPNPGQKISAAQHGILKAWLDGDVLDKKPNPSTPPNSPDSSNQQITTDPEGNVTFVIKLGTGKGDWNTPESKITLKVGRDFTIVNNDIIPHQIHTNGNAPFPHPNPAGVLPNGGTATIRVLNPYSGGPTYDHIHSGPNQSQGKIYIEATN
jgi:hypothetical protein